MVKKFKFYAQPQPLIRSSGSISFFNLFLGSLTFQGNKERSFRVLTRLLFRLKKKSMLTSHFILSKYFVVNNFYLTLNNIVRKNSTTLNRLNIRNKGSFVAKANFLRSYYKIVSRFSIFTLKDSNYLKIQKLYNKIYNYIYSMYFKYGFKFLLSRKFKLSKDVKLSFFNFLNEQLFDRGVYFYGVLNTKFLIPFSDRSTFFFLRKYSQNVNLKKQHVFLFKKTSFVSLNKKLSCFRSYSTFSSAKKLNLYSFVKIFLNKNKFKYKIFIRKKARLRSKVKGIFLKFNSLFIISSINCLLKRNFMDLYLSKFSQSFNFDEVLIKYQSELKLFNFHKFLNLLSSFFKTSTSLRRYFLKNIINTIIDKDSNEVKNFALNFFFYKHLKKKYKKKSKKFKKLRRRFLFLKRKRILFFINFSLLKVFYTDLIKFFLLKKKNLRLLNFRKKLIKKVMFKKKKVINNVFDNLFFLNSFLIKRNCFLENYFDKTRLLWKDKSFFFTSRSNKRNFFYFFFGYLKFRLNNFPLNIYSFFRFFNRINNSFNVIFSLILKYKQKYLLNKLNFKSKSYKRFVKPKHIKKKRKLLKKYVFFFPKFGSKSFKVYNRKFLLNSLFYLRNLKRKYFTKHYKKGRKVKYTFLQTLTWYRKKLFRASFTKLMHHYFFNKKKKFNNKILLKKFTYKNKLTRIFLRLKKIKKFRKILNFKFFLRRLRIFYNRKHGFYRRKNYKFFSKNRNKKKIKFNYKYIYKSKFRFGVRVSPKVYKISLKKQFRIKYYRFFLKFKNYRLLNYKYRHFNYNFLKIRYLKSFFFKRNFLNLTEVLLFKKKVYGSYKKHFKLYKRLRKFKRINLYKHINTSKSIKYFFRRVKFLKYLPKTFVRHFPSSRIILFRLKQFNALFFYTGFKFKEVRQEVIKRDKIIRRFFSFKKFLIVKNFFFTYNEKFKSFFLGKNLRLKFFFFIFRKKKKLFQKIFKIKKRKLKLRKKFLKKGNRFFSKKYLQLKRYKNLIKKKKLKKNYKSSNLNILKYLSQEKRNLYNIFFLRNFFSVMKSFEYVLKDITPLAVKLVDRRFASRIFKFPVFVSSVQSYKHGLRFLKNSIKILSKNYMKHSFISMFLKEFIFMVNRSNKSKFLKLKIEIFRILYKTRPIISLYLKASSNVHKKPYRRHKTVFY
jgi:hypothetical protein